ncbi:MAG TPA: NUDIX hydrolase [Acidimicrobiia bacterium]|nr:NUDIX hydrolase [Acidimicrobiia bacterium]
MVEEVLASGGVVWRSTGAEIEILLIHRDRYRDWTLPKGKLDKGESDLGAALREVREETGMVCKPGVPVGTMRYGLDNGKVKRVHYWSMEATGGSFAPNDEVDEVVWATPAVAGRILTYQHDIDLVTSLQENWWNLTGRIYLVRHATAGRRKDWKGEDVKRPLSNRGWEQANEIGTFLADAQVERLLSSSYVRCRQTFEPAAALLGLKVERSGALLEGSGSKRLEKLMRKLGNTPAALCSHGDIIPALLERLSASGTVLESEVEFAKGSIWAIDVVEGTFPSARYIPPFA